MNYKIALIRGDGIGPEVVGEAVQVMEAVGKKFGHSFTFEDILMGGCATDAVGVSYPEGTAEKCRACDAVLLGAVGGPKWGSDKPAEQRPETALLAIRKGLGLLVTENMFGDILSDEASMVTGSIGLLPSASIGDAAPGLYEPIHGSAPDIAGQDKANPIATILSVAMMFRYSFHHKANPIATILSVAMMFRYSFHLAAEAQAIENAVDAVLAEGWRTADIAEPGVIPIGTREMGRRIREKL